MVISIISGSQAQNSVSIRVAVYLKKHLQILLPAAEILIIESRHHNIPLDTATYKNDGSAPEALSTLVNDVYRTDGFILLTPEYNGSYTPSLKNLLNHFPKLNHKPCAIVTGSDGALGGMRAAQQLQLLIGSHFGLLSPYMLIIPTMHTKFDAEGNLIDEKFQTPIDKFSEEFIWLMRSIHPHLK